MKSIQYDINKQDFMTLRPFNINDAPTILSWCKDKHAFRLWSADRYKDYPAKPEEMMEQYNSNNMYPLTAVVDNLIMVFDNNPSAIHCYESVGFVVTGTDTYAIDGEEWTGKEMELVIKNNLYR